ncbi:MAG: ABC transporter permease [Schleiferilactobacillus harbinensis]|jgi:ABC-2 type transport system permease protein|nr:ABC transporter permease [Schleiferilactobacillus harbinensis]
MSRSDRHVGFLLRANLKQNLKYSVVWIIILEMMMASGAFKMQTIMESTGKGVQDLIKMLKMPGMAGLFGAMPDGVTLNSATVFAGIMMVFMVILDALYVMPLMVRDTRGQEESGLLEMVRARTVGRTAAVAAALWELVIVNAILFVLYIGTIISLNLKGADFNGTLLFTLALIIANLMFGAFTLLIAQLTSTARSANMIAYTVLVAAYLVRTVTDIENTDWTWLSPIGWAQKTNAYSDNNYWPLLLMLGVAILLAGITWQLAKTRDLGTGILPERAGRAHAAGYLRSIPALLFRTTWGVVLGWLIGAVVAGGIFGGVLNNVGDIVKTNPLYRQMMSISQVNAANKTMVLSFLALYILLFVAFGVVAGAQVVFRLKEDEDKGYLGMIHATKQTRLTISLSYYVIGLIVSLLVFVIGIIMVYYTGNASLKEPLAQEYLTRMLVAGLPAVFALVSLAILLVGWVPRISAVFWAYMGIGLLVQMFGALLNLSKDSGKFSPFGWLNQAPLHAITTPWLSTMVIITIAFLILGVIGYRQRDVE